MRKVMRHYGYPAPYHPTGAGDLCVEEIEDNPQLPRDAQVSQVALDGVSKKDKNLLLAAGQ